MALNLTTEEYEIVETFRKRSGRPTYYSADQASDQEITTDMEAALILAPPDAKQECRTRLALTATQAEYQLTRKSILKTALSVDLNNAKSQYGESLLQMTTQQSFVSKFERFAEVGEIGLLLRDAQLGLDEEQMRADRAQHQVVCSTILLQRLLLDGVSTELLLEQKSWMRVLSEYTLG